MILIVLTLISFSGFGFAADVAWSHHNEHAWPGKCTVGTEQSPIDIRPHNTLADPHATHIRGDLVYRGYSNVRVTARNTGYKLRWAVVPGEQAPVLSGGPLRSNYSFAEVHFHWLSEHSKNGIKYPLEIHLVHVKNGLTFDEALLQRDGVAVIGIWAEVASQESSHVLDEMLPAVDSILSRSNEESHPFNIDLTRLFSPTPQAYFTYHGSLTVPLCPEVVTWIVMENPTTVAHESYKNLTRADLSGINNDRSVQPLGQRIVYRSNAVSGACARAASTLLGSMAALVACFGSKVASTLFRGMSNLFDAKKRLFGKCRNQIAG